jgi:hypothetical protein
MASLTSAPPQLGDVIYCRYQDHAFFKDTNPSHCRPMLREAVGWLGYEDNEFIKISFERFAIPFEPEGSRQRETCIAVLKSAIIELRRLNV